MSAIYKNGVEYGNSGKAYAEWSGTQAEYDAAVLAGQIDEGTIVTITDKITSGAPSGGSSVSVSHTGTASSSGVRKQQITVDSIAYDVDGTAYMEQTITTSTANTVTATFSNAAITVNSAIIPMVSKFGLKCSNISISAGSCVITIPPQSSAESITVRIYIR